MKAVITEADSFTDPMKIRSGNGFSISIAGTFTATISLQRVRSASEPTAASAWATVESYTSPAEKNGIDFGTHWYRLGCPTGGYTSGTATVEISA